MADDLRTRIAAVLRSALLEINYSSAEKSADGEQWVFIDGTVMPDDLADAVIRELPELPVKISTEDQLDALPFLTVIREVRPLRKGIDYGGIYERRTSGWQCIAGTWVEPERNGQPMLPVMVLWRGKDEQ